MEGERRHAELSELGVAWFALLGPVYRADPASS